MVFGAVRDGEEQAAASLTTEKAMVTRFRDAAREAAGLLVQSERVRRAAARYEMYFPASCTTWSKFDVLLTCMFLNFSIEKLLASRLNLQFKPHSSVVRYRQHAPTLTTGWFGKELAKPWHQPTLVLMQKPRMAGDGHSR